jgi:CHAT domain-containing protein
MTSELSEEADEEARAGPGRSSDGSSRSAVPAHDVCLEEIDEMVAGPLRTQWQESWQTLALGRTTDELYELADRLKLERFDVFLHTDLRRASRNGRFIYGLGKSAECARVMALGLLARGDAAGQGGHARRAMPLFERSGALYEEAGDHVGWARSRGGWLIAATHAGLVTECDIDEMDEACAVLRRAGQTLRLANVRQNVAHAYLSLARYSKAKAVYDSALMFLGSGESRSERNLRALLLMNIGCTLLWLVDVDRAREQLVRARSIFEDIGNTGMVALVDMHLSVTERLRWHVHDALRLVRSAVSGLIEAKQPSAALALFYQADILLLLDRPEEALRAARSAVEVLGSLQVSQDLADALCMQARALWRCGDVVGAESALQRAEALFRTGTAHHNAYPLVIERALLLLEQDRAVEAKDAAFTVLKRKASQDTALHRSMAMWVAAAATLKLGDTMLAQEMAVQTIKAADRLHSPELRLHGHLILARIARDKGDLHEALAHYDAVSEALRMSIGELAYEQRTGFLQDKGALYMEALQTALAARDATKALVYLEQQRARATWVLIPGREALEGAHIAGNDTTQRARILIELEDVRARHRAKSTVLQTTSRASPAYKGAKQELMHLTRQLRDLLEMIAQRIAQPTAFDVASIPASIPDNTVVLAYALTRDDIVIFSIRRAGVEPHIVEGGTRQLGVLDQALQLNVDTLTQRMRRSNPAEALEELARWGGTLRKTLQGLWNLLIAPVERLLPRESGTLALVPHGLLHALPLPAMFDGERYLVERCTVRCLDSCQALAAKHDSGGVTNYPSLTVGYSDMSLPEAESEAREIAELMSGDAWTGVDASGERLRQRLSEHAKPPAYLHIAAHGEVRLDIPSASFVLLADGPFHPTDAVALDLHGCRLVTLSACQTGLGRMSGGDEQIGLVRAFCHAGAEAVLSTLWQVDDATTSGFMRLFYKQLAHGLAPAQALRGAQRAFLQDGGIHAHPYFWAGFQLMTQAVRSVVQA